MCLVYRVAHFPEDTNNKLCCEARKMEAWEEEQVEERGG